MSRAEPRVDKGSKLYVQPAELARKLVKEMEDHRVSRSSRVSVRNSYTIFLCPDDYDRLRDHEDQLLDKLERHLYKHVRSKGYQVAGEISVTMTVDYDLKLGYFGILAERDAPGLVEEELPARACQEEPVRVAKAAAAAAPAGRPAPVTPSRPNPARSEHLDGSTRLIPAGDAAEMGLARQTIVITTTDRVREFNQGRVIIGRARDVDFVIENADVSRRHAVLYWSNGDIVLEDLGSTNGTMVNGYPISSTVVGPGDVVTIGDCRLKVGTS